MTDHSRPINPLIARGIGPGNFSGKPEAYVRISGTMVACSFEEYVSWLNANEKRRGTWVIKYLESQNGEPPKRTVEWLGQNGSDEYLRGIGIAPPAQRRTERAQPIDRYISDYGRAE